jgi:hypothetical protein|tara:strand:- start:664 stop:894 length:231 start_codon:yes stop_codon:yes gene_type:complete
VHLQRFEDLLIGHLFVARARAGGGELVAVVIGELAQRELAVLVLVDALPRLLEVSGAQPREDLAPRDAELVLTGFG